ncbi:hypothetical protein ACLKA6_018560 [Drosophila palustris]
MSDIPFNEKYYMKGGLAYTEDHVVIKNLFFLANSEKELEPQLLKTYFERYGRVERLHLFPRKKQTTSMGNNIGRGTRAGYVVFANSCDAAKALWVLLHNGGGCRIIVGPSYTWYQPDAEKMPQGPDNVDPNKPPAAILKLNDHCLEHICKQLSLLDGIHFARTCFRFRSVYEGISPHLHESINFELLKAMSAWNLRDFFELSGRNIKVIEGTIPRKNCHHVCSFLSKNCINLQSLRIRNNSFILEVPNIFKLFSNLNSLQVLELHKCDLNDEHLQALKHLKQLKTLDLSKNSKLTGLYMNCLPNSIESLILSLCFRLKPKSVNEMLTGLPLLKELHTDGVFLSPHSQDAFNVSCCTSLEILSISYAESFIARYEHIAMLPSLKKLIMRISYQEGKMSPKLITWLVEQKSKQLEHLEILNAYLFNNEILREIGKLTALQMLILPGQNVITDRGLEALFNLQELREIKINSTSGITNKGVLQLILVCPKLQVLHLKHCRLLTDQLLLDIILNLKDNGNHRPLPIKLYMIGTRITQSSLRNADVAAKNIIDVL